MNEITAYLFMMLVYTFCGGLQIWMVIDEFKRNHLFRAGVSVMLAISMILLMAKHIFTW